MQFLTYPWFLWHEAARSISTPHGQGIVTQQKHYYLNRNLVHVFYCLVKEGIWQFSWGRGVSKAKVFKAKCEKIQASRELVYLTDLSINC